MIEKITIAGAGTMGHSMALIFARYGYQVTLWNHRAPKLTAAKAAIAETNPEIAEKICYAASDDAFRDCDLVVESVSEDMEIKKGFYQYLTTVISPEAIIATNTSGLSINTLSGFVDHPDRFLGMPWFNPPTLVPLIEIIRADVTRQDVVDTIYDLALAIDKKPAIVNQDVYGFAANRLQMAVLREACALVKRGVISAEGIDAVMKYALGFRWACLGPLETIDLGGIDIFQHLAEYLVPDLEDSHEVPALIQEHYDRGEYGLKTGRGIYDYSDGKGQEAVRCRDQKMIAIYNALYGNEKEAGPAQ